MKAKIKATGKVVEIDRNNIVQTVDRLGFISHEWAVEDENGKTIYLKDEEIEIQ